MLYFKHRSNSLLSRLENIFLSKINNNGNNYSNDDDPPDQISIMPFEFWHMLKVHTINTGEEQDWNRDRRNSSQPFHIFILFEAHLVKTNFLYTIEKLTLIINSINNV